MELVIWDIFYLQNKFILLKNIYVIKYWFNPFVPNATFLYLLTFTGGKKGALVTIGLNPSKEKNVKRVADEYENICQWR